MLGVSTIGNAILIAYDDNPILATDPWFGDEKPAYFGSWGLSHRIPPDCKADILNAKYIWFSHGHPDHLNPDSLTQLHGKNILLGDHVGGRIADASPQHLSLPNDRPCVSPCEGAPVHQCGVESVVKWLGWRYE